MHIVKRPHNPPRKCLFCGGKPISKEHLFSDWISALVPRTAERHTQFIATIQEIGSKPLEAVPTKREGDILSRRLKVVCRKCNNEWMSGIDDRARPLLGRLILGHTHCVSQKEQGAILDWIVLKTIVGEHDDPRTAAISKEEAHEFYRTRKRPSNWRCWIASYNGNEWSQGARFTHVGAGIGHRVQQGAYVVNTRLFSVQTTTMVIGKLVVHACSTDAPNFLYDFQGVLNKKLVAMPSSSDEEIAWGPPDALDDSEIGVIAYSLVKGLQTKPTP